jgi:phosphopantothenate---cysteine ligase (CTP)
MNILVTAGNTQTPIDRVRCITNIFSGRTGTRIALQAHERGHAVTLLTSHSELVRELAPARSLPAETWTVRPYRTFDDLHCALAEIVPEGGFHAIIHCAAVSDFTVAGIYVPTAASGFDPHTGEWRAGSKLADATTAKVSSRHDEVWLRLLPAPKLIDRMRQPWGFRGVLVKFKLEAGVSEAELMSIAERSRRQSDADFLVANTLEGMHDVAFLCAREGPAQRVPRGELPARLIQAVEAAAGRTVRSDPH